MNLEVKQTILNKIKEYNTIVVSRHIRPDGDAYGSTRGLVKILRDTYPEKNVYLVNNDFSKALEFLGGEDTIDDSVYADALCIVIDTGTASRISNKQYSLAKEVIKIDHHIIDKPYGDIVWVEDFRSSACEMIADFWYTFKDELKMSKEAATYIYCGMVTDSGRFKYEGVTGETLRLASYLLDYNIDTARLFANLYLEDYDYYKFEAYVYEHMQITKNGVAYIYVDKDIQEKFNLSLEQASSIVSALSKIKGSLIWIAFIDNMISNHIRVRLRSRFLGINDIALKYHGGGHDMSAGATVYSVEEMNALINEADELLGEYKRTHNDWL